VWLSKVRLFKVVNIFSSLNDGENKGLLGR